MSELIEDESNPFTNVSKNTVIGNITWLNEDADKVTIRLGSASINVDNFMIARTNANTLTAVLKTTQYKKNRILGAEVVFGRPNVGDQVILRDDVELPEGWADAVVDRPHFIDKYPFVLHKDRKTDKKEPSSRTSFIRKTNNEQKPSLE